MYIPITVHVFVGKTTKPLRTEVGMVSKKSGRQTHEGHDGRSSGSPAKCLLKKRTLEDLLVGGLEHAFFPIIIILGISSSQLTFIFFRGVGIPATSLGFLGFVLSLDSSIVMIRFNCHKPYTSWAYKLTKTYCI